MVEVSGRERNDKQQLSTCSAEAGSLHVLGEALGEARPAGARTALGARSGREERRSPNIRLPNYAVRDAYPRPLPSSTSTLLFLFSCSVLVFNEIQTTMKITVKTLQQKVFQVRSLCAPEVRNRSLIRDSRHGQIDAEGSDTVADLKSKIQQSQGHTPESQKIIFAGEDLPIVHAVGNHA